MKNRALLSLTASMLIFGTIGIFRKYIPLSSGLLAFSRGIIGAAFIIILLFVIKKPFSFKNTGKNLFMLCFSGALMGFNWILLFESYSHTTVAAATLCYYMAPVIVILLSPFVFKEKLGAKKLLCVTAAVLGMVLVSGILQTGADFSQLRGILLALGAAALYAAVVIMNKTLAEVPAFEKTAVQLISSAAAVLPYVIFVEGFSFKEIAPYSGAMLLLVGILHTGIAYALYFGSIGHLKAQTAAIFSYIDPVAAIILSALVLKETIGPKEIFGAVLILGSVFISELPEKEKTP